MPTSISPCRFMKVYIKPNGEPILGTMYDSPNQQIPNGCMQALVPNTQADLSKLCMHSNGIRYFYKVDRSGNVLANSMFEATTPPPSMCSGSHTTLEFVVTKP